MSQFFANFH